MNGRTALVTGASAGIGRATVRQLVERGARVIAAARRADRVEELCAQFGPERARAVALDVRDRSAVSSAISSLFAGGWAFDILVNNAGLAAGLDTIDQADPDDWDRMIDTNVKGLLNVSRAAIPLMKEQGAGHIVNVGSIAGREVYSKGSVYCASKFAVRALNKGMRLDLNGTGLRVTSVDPGLVETEFSVVRFAGDRERAKTPYLGMTPLKAEDVAEAIVWALDRPAHVNVEELLLMPTDQAASTVVHRR